MAAVLVLLAGCAGTFVRPDDNAFTLGRSTYAEVVKVMGEPKLVSSTVRNGTRLKSIQYVFVSGWSEAAEDGVHPSRSMSFYFHDDTLVGESFFSSYKSDSSNFDETKLDQIKKGVATRAEVVRLLGRPAARYIAPAINETDGEVYGYHYHTVRGNKYSGFKRYTKIVRIAFDAKGIVSKVDLTVSTRG